MASNTSSDVDINDYKTNDEIDSIWLQMMNLKNQDTIGTPGNTQLVVVVVVTGQQVSKLINQT